MKTAHPHIVFEDEVLLVCNKPAGLMVEPDRNNHPNLLHQVKKYISEKSGTPAPYVQHLHRIDRPVSGLVLFTKNKEYLRNLSEQFAQREVKKEYVAFTNHAPPILSGKLEHWHRKEKKKGSIVPEGTEYAEKVLLTYTATKEGEYFRWEILLHTGKFHQIRAQLSYIGCPIIGDATYGSDIPYKENVIALFATGLTIKHPVTNKEMHFSVPVIF